MYCPFRKETIIRRSGSHTDYKEERDEHFKECSGSACKAFNVVNSDCRMLIQ